MGEANAIVLAAARKINEAIKDLHRAGCVLERHPDFVFVRGRDPLPPADRITLPTWRYASILSVVRDVELGEAARVLALDVREDEENMADCIREARKGARMAKAA